MPIERHAGRNAIGILVKRAILLLRKVVSVELIQRRAGPNASIRRLRDVKFASLDRRFQALGRIGARLHVLVFTPRAGKAHVVSLRKANRREVKRYEAQA